MAEQKKSVLGTLAEVFEVLGKAKKGIKELADHAESIILRKFNLIKKRTSYFFFTLLFLTLSVLFILGGALLFLSRFFPLDVLLIFAGALCVIIALMLGRK